MAGNEQFARFSPFGWCGGPEKDRRVWVLRFGWSGRIRRSHSRILHHGIDFVVGQCARSGTP